jgi:hypothetical protein
VGDHERLAWGPTVAGGFTNRLGGASRPPYAERNLALHVGDDERDVLRNRAALAAEVGAARIAAMRQVHADGVAVIGPGPAGAEEPEVDAMVTSEPGVALLVLVADCVPVLMADPVARVVGAVHAGRRGVALDVVGRAVAAMRALGAQPQRMRAALGPSICGRCYPLGEPARSEVLRAAPAAEAYSRAGDPAVDLRGGLEARLLSAGVAVEVTGPCTYESPRHFSYRRDPVTGRAGGWVMVR